METKKFNYKLGLDTLLFWKEKIKTKLVLVIYFKIKKFGGDLIFSEEFVF